MKKIVTIGGGNGQSSLLDGISEYMEGDYSLSSIVSMSDDGRTTGKLMREFSKQLGLHLPPPGDLRRCLFSLSSSSFKKEFMILFETVIDIKGDISDFSIGEMLDSIGEPIGVVKYLKENGSDFVNYILPLNSEIKGHKFGNLLMASLYYNLDKDYGRMIDLMHDILIVEGSVIPVTTKRALIKAVLGNGEEIETQDRISNVADYNSGIADLELMECSIDATHSKQVHDVIVDADYIIIGPGDLFTSLISNFIIAGVKESIKESKAKIIYIGNSTNKGGETTGLTQLDFVNKIERFLGKKIDYFLLNKGKNELTGADLEDFKNDISIKGGDYLFLSKGEKKELENRGIHVVDKKLLNDKSFYRHSKKKVVKELEKIIF